MSYSINNVTLVGRLTRDPELRTTTTGKQVCSFGIAVNKRFKPQNPDEKDADFFNVTAWGTTAEFVSNYAGKGRLVGITGRIETRKYTNKDGIEVSTVDIVADQVALLDRPKDDTAAPVGAAVANVGSNDVAPDDYDPFAEE